MNDELLRLKALSLVQAADISSLLSVVQSIEEVMRPSAPNFPDVKATFVRHRKEALHMLLEDYEDHDPALAAMMQRVIDESARHYPFDYE